MVNGMIQAKADGDGAFGHESSVGNGQVKLPKHQPSFGKPLMVICGMVFGLFAVWVVYLNLSQRDYPVSPEVLTSTQGAEAPQQENRSANMLTKKSNQDPDAKTANSSPQESSAQESTQEQVSKSGAKKFPFTISLVYSPGYLINLGGLERMHPFDIKKYQKIHNQLVADGLVTNEKTMKPSPLTVEDLKLVHTDGYLKDLKERKKIAAYLEAPVLEFAPVSLETAVLNPFLRASGGTLLAARESLKCGIGINIGGGYHHAMPDKGEGFCLFADVPISILKLQKEGLIKKALIIDVDVHQGNGTAVCLADDDSTLTFSMHQGNIYPIPKADSDLDIELKSGMEEGAFLKAVFCAFVADACPRKRGECSPSGRLSAARWRSLSVWDNRRARAVPLLVGRIEFSGVDSGIRRAESHVLRDRTRRFATGFEFRSGIDCSQFFLQAVYLNRQQAKHTRCLIDA